jgi:tRNA threonylcarbamoyladenosine biosynthesis protein TsaB
MTSRVSFRADALLGSSASVGPVLGLDTGSPVASAGLVARGCLLAQASHAADTHGASVPQLVEDLVRSAGLSVRDLKGIAVAIGPGSFTGLRIALSYAKGMASALRCPVAGVPSLDALALCALESGALAMGATVCPVIDARKAEVYAALYQVVPDGLEKLSDDLVVNLEWLVSRVPDNAVLVGDQRAADAESIISARGRRTMVLADSELPLRGRLVAALGALMLARGEADNPVTLEPLYVRPPEATLKVAGARRRNTNAEGLWSREKSSSSSSMPPMTRS